LTTKKAVLIIYMLTVGLCLSAVIMVNIRDERAGLFLIILGTGAIVFIRKLGYFEYVASDKVYGWFKDFVDETGLSRERRSFLSLQIDMARAADFDDLWIIFRRAMEILDFDLAELVLDPKIVQTEDGGQKRLKWHRDGFDSDGMIADDYRFKLELPLMTTGMTTEQDNYGVLWLVKDLQRHPVSQHTFRRVEQLRRSFISALEHLGTGKK